MIDLKIQYSYNIWTVTNMFHWSVTDEYFTLAEGRESKLDLAIKMAKNEIKFRKVQDQIIARKVIVGNFKPVD
jgi:hypothetical protein